MGAGLWRDMLEWYRDSKRAFMSLRIDQTLAIAREYLGPNAKVIVYLPRIRLQPGRVG